MTDSAVVIPIRAFLQGKSRLGGVLPPAERAALARRMAQTVVAAAGDLRVVVVSSAPEVRLWAATQDLTLLHDPGSLDGAAAVGTAWAAAQGMGRVVVAHADLPFARSLAPLIRDAAAPTVAVVPCQRDEGTPVLSVPTNSPFTFSYGPGSFRRHAAEARRRGLGFRVLRDPDLAYDVDGPADLVGVRAVSLCSA